MRGFLIAPLLVLLVACNGPLPKAECDPASQTPNAPLQCDTAVNAALRVLPGDHSTITRIQFLYGDARPYDCGGILTTAENTPVCACVVFTFPDRSRQYVALAQLHGSLTARSPAPY
jgi:hypothetical protein